MAIAYAVFDEDGDQIAFAVIKDGHGEFYLPRYRSLSGALTLRPHDSSPDEQEEERPRPRRRSRD